MLKDGNSSQFSLRKFVRRWRRRFLLVGLLLAFGIGVIVQNSFSPQPSSRYRFANFSFGRLNRFNNASAGVQDALRRYLNVTKVSDVKKVLQGHSAARLFLPSIAGAVTDGESVANLLHLEWNNNTKGSRWDSASANVSTDAGAAAEVLEPHLPSNLNLLIFTMDSIAGYSDRAQQGGPAGELKVRNSLQTALGHFNVSFHVATSDENFDALYSSKGPFSHILLDEFTVVNPSWQVRVDHPNVFAFAFFGTASHRSGLPPDRFLTPYPYPTLGNTFLGFVVHPLPPEEDGIQNLQNALSTDLFNPSQNASFLASTNLNASASAPTTASTRRRRTLGMVWGKKLSYFEGHEPLLESLKSEFPQIEFVTGISDGGPVAGLRNIGHQPPAEWRALLHRMCFLLGLGDPLAGPSALEAIAAGAVYINAVLPGPHEAHPHMYSQHPFLSEAVGMPRVCDARVDNRDAVFKCVRHAVAAAEGHGGRGLAPYVPPEFGEEAYLHRVRGLLLRRGGGGSSSGGSNSTNMTLK